MNRQEYGATPQAEEPGEDHLARKRAKHAAYMREYRRRKGARPGANGPPVSTPCPDPTAYTRHVRNKEPVDPACKEAWAIYRRIGAEAYRADGKTIRAGLMTKYGLT